MFGDGVLRQIDRETSYYAILRLDAGLGDCLLEAFVLKLLVYNNYNIQVLISPEAKFIAEFLGLKPGSISRAEKELYFYRHIRPVDIFRKAVSRISPYSQWLLTLSRPQSVVDSSFLRRCENCEVTRLNSGSRYVLVSFDVSRANLRTIPKVNIADVVEHHYKEAARVVEIVELDYNSELSSEENFKVLLSLFQGSNFVGFVGLDNGVSVVSVLLGRSTVVIPRRRIFSMHLLENLYMLVSDKSANTVFLSRELQRWY